jgi:hypothetical protein
MKTDYAPKNHLIIEQPKEPILTYVQKVGKWSLRIYTVISVLFFTYCLACSLVEKL